jgi:hypothetical protein
METVLLDSPQPLATGVDGAFRVVARPSTQEPGSERLTLEYVYGGLVHRVRVMRPRREFGLQRSTRSFPTLLELLDFYAAGAHGDLLAPLLPVRGWANLHDRHYGRVDPALEVYTAPSPSRVLPSFRSSVIPFDQGLTPPLRMRERQRKKKKKRKEGK